MSTYVGAGSYLQDGLHLDGPVNDVVMTLIRAGLAKAELSSQRVRSALVDEGRVVFEVFDQGVPDVHLVEVALP